MKNNTKQESEKEKKNLISRTFSNSIKACFQNKKYSVLI